MKLEKKINSLVRRNIQYVHCIPLQVHSFLTDLLFPFFSIHFPIQTKTWRACCPPSTCSSKTCVSPYRLPSMSRPLQRTCSTSFAPRLLCVIPASPFPQYVHFYIFKLARSFLKHPFAAWVWAEVIERSPSCIEVLLH